VSAVLITGEAMVKACRFTVPVSEQPLRSARRVDHAVLVLHGPALLRFAQPAELTMLFWCFMAQLCFASLSPQS
jgi:hypothetical protein